MWIIPGCSLGKTGSRATGLTYFASFLAQKWVLGNRAFGYIESEQLQGVMEPNLTNDSVNFSPFLACCLSVYSCFLICYRSAINPLLAYRRDDGYRCPLLFVLVAAVAKISLTAIHQGSETFIATRRCSSAASVEILKADTCI